MFYVQQLKM